MIKEDLYPGNVVELRDGTKCLFTNDERLYRLDDGTWHCKLSDFLNDLTTDEQEYDIVKVYEDYTCSDVLWERNDTKSKLRQIYELLGQVLEEEE